MGKKRRILKWLNPGFQRKYVFFLVSIIFVLSSLLVTVFWSFSDRMMETLVERGLMSERSLFLLIQTHVDRGEIEQARVKLRESDEFKDVAELLNSAIDSLAKRR